MATVTENQKIEEIKRIQTNYLASLEEQKRERNRVLDDFLRTIENKKMEKLRSQIAA